MAARWAQEGGAPLNAVPDTSTRVLNTARRPLFPSVMAAVSGVRRTFAPQAAGQPTGR